MRLSQKQIVLLISAAIVITTLIAYEPIRHNGFVNYDDDSYITNNPLVTSGITPQSLWQAFTKTYAANWHPLTWLSHIVDCQIFGLNPLGHHCVSVLIHIANALLVFWILTNITGTVWPSAFVAAVFALHPVQVGSVAWAAERKTVLSGLFWLLTMAVYIRYARQPRLSRYMLLLFIYGLCIMTKPVVVTLPLVLLLLDYWPLERFRWGQQTGAAKNGKTNHKSPGWLIAEKIPLLAISAFSSIMTLVAQKQVGAIETLGKMSLDYRVANMFLSYISYIGKLIWPSRLAVFYPHPRINFSDRIVIICALLFVITTAVNVYTGRQRKYAAVGWLWYVGTLVPVIGLVQSGAQAMANRYMYIPMLGLLIIIGWGIKDYIDKQPKARIAAITLGIAALFSLLILTRMQVRHWENSLTLFEYTLNVTGDNPIAENNYGTALLAAGRGNEAIPHFKNAIRISPTFVEARINLGKFYAKQGKFDEAVVYFNDILRQNEGNAEAHYNIALALAMQMRYDDAIRHFARTIEINPKYPSASQKMGIVLLAAGRIDEAIACFNKLLRQSGDNAEVHYTLATALGTQKRYDEAIEHLAKVLQLNPMYPEAHNKIGLALMAVGRNDEAIKYLNEGLKISKDPGNIYANLGSAYIQAGKYELAIENLTKSIELKPNNIDALNKLAWLYAAIDNASIHNAQKAVEFAQRGCELTGYKDPMLLDTLAVAYAAAGRFDEAKVTAQKALDIAKQAGRENLAAEIEKRIKLYEAGQPYQQK